MQVDRRETSALEIEHIFNALRAEDLAVRVCGPPWTCSSQSHTITTRCVEDTVLATILKYEIENGNKRRGRTGDTATTQQIRVPLFV